MQQRLIILWVFLLIKLLGHQIALPVSHTEHVTHESRVCDKCQTRYKLSLFFLQNCFSFEEKWIRQVKILREQFLNTILQGTCYLQNPTTIAASQCHRNFLILTVAKIYSSLKRKKKKIYDYNNLNLKFNGYKHIKVFKFIKKISFFKFIKKISFSNTNYQSHLLTMHHQLSTTWTFHIKLLNTLIKENKLNYLN